MLLKSQNLDSELPSTRVRSEFKKKLKDEAAKQHRTLSQLVRMILETEAKNNFRSVR